MAALVDRSQIIWLDGGESHVGTERPEHSVDGESPCRKTIVGAFGLSKFCVTNAEFTEFVQATGHRTDAEKFGWSYVFVGQIDHDGPKPEGAPWWTAKDEALWSSPLGPGSDTRGLEDHPVVHISANDAEAYARWAGGRLPTEAEWEFAARASPEDVRYPWGDTEPDDENQIFCNIWQGNFPELNTEKDGYFATAPVESFAANGFGFYNMSGNVWEWTADRFKIRSLKQAAKKRNRHAQKENQRVLKGGSFLCHKSYCWRYRIAARTGQSMDTSAAHTGLRVAFDA